MNSKFLLFLVIFIIGSAVGDQCDERVRSRNGVCNNLDHPDWGTPGSFFTRFGDQEYASDNYPIRFPQRPHPRVISNRVFRQGSGQIPEPLGFNLAFMGLAQFITHDVTDNGRATGQVDRALLVPETPENSDNPDIFCSPPRGVPVSPDRPITNETCGGIIYSNSSFTVVDGVRQIHNNINSYMELSQIYGNSEETENQLRRHSKGELKTQDYVNHTSVRFPPRRIFKNGQFLTIIQQTGSVSNYLPNLETTTVEHGRLAMPVCAPFQPPIIPGVPVPICFPKQDILVSGDGRVTENLNLHLFHLLFFREHNRLAKEISILNPSFNDEKIYRDAQKTNIAQYQNILYNEFVPQLLGSEEYRYGGYTGYRKNINPATTMPFATAAFRLHTMVCDVLPTPNECGNEGRVNPDSVLEEPNGYGFCGGRFAAGTLLPIIFDTGPIEHILRGMIWTPMQKMDQLHSDGIRELRAGFLDIPALSIERGRDNGLPNYDTIRQYYYGLRGSQTPYKVPAWSVYQSKICKDLTNEDSLGPDPIACFNVITSNLTLAIQLRNLYGKINNIDGFVGLRSEDRTDGSMFGPTSSGILAREFWTNRASDRFYFANSKMFNSQPLSLFNEQELDIIDNTTLADLMRRNFNINTQNNVLLVPDDVTELYPDHCDN